MGLLAEVVISMVPDKQEEVRENVNIGGRPSNNSNQEDVSLLDSKKRKDVKFEE